jgi:hypothetical protein
MEDQEKSVKEYEVEFNNEILESTNGMYGPIATIMNFFMQFPERNDILSFVL